MSLTIFAVLAVVSVVVTGLAAGVFFAFSTFVMGGLRRTADEHSSAAMLGINADAVRPPFMTVLGGALVVPVAAGIVGLAGGHEGAGWFLTAAAIYLAGCFVVTAAANVPLNNRLASAADPLDAWRRYAEPWVAWNHVRTAASTAAAALCAVGLVV
jgi:uncharacterized membrane protein